MTLNEFMDLQEGDVVEVNTDVGLVRNLTEWGANVYFPGDNISLHYDYPKIIFLARRL